MINEQKAKILHDRNLCINRDFTEMYLQGRTAGKLSIMAIYQHLAGKYNKSLMQIRRVIRGYKNRRAKVVFPTSTEQRKFFVATAP